MACVRVNSHWFLHLIGAFSKYLLMCFSRGNVSTAVKDTTVPVQTEPLLKMAPCPALLVSQLSERSLLQWDHFSAHCNDFSQVDWYSSTLIFKACDLCFSFCCGLFNSYNQHHPGPRTTYSLHTTCSALLCGACQPSQPPCLGRSLVPGTEWMVSSCANCLLWGERAREESEAS